MAMPDLYLNSQRLAQSFHCDQVNPARPQRSRDVGEAIMADFWSNDLGSFNLEAGTETSYGEPLEAALAWQSAGRACCKNRSAKSGAVPTASRPPSRE